MLTLKILGKDGAVRGEWKGINIVAEFEGELIEGDKIKVSADGCDFIALKLDELID